MENATVIGMNQLHKMMFESYVSVLPTPQDLEVSVEITRLSITSVEGRISWMPKGECELKNTDTSYWSKTSI